jgi:hypothetical protein
MSCATMDSYSPLTATAVAAACSSPTSSSDLSREINALRTATSRYHSFDAAVADGYGTQLTDCMVDSSLGGWAFTTPSRA